MQQKRRVIQHWDHFKQVTGIQSITDITPEVVIKDRDEIYERQLKPKVQSDIFTRIRRLLTFAKSRAIAIKPLEARDGTARLEALGRVLKLRKEHEKQSRG